MDLKEIFASANLNESAIKNIEKAFNEHVEMRAAEIAAEHINENAKKMEKEYQDKISELEDSYKQKLNESDESINESKAVFEKEAEEHLYEAYEEMKNFQEKIVDVIDSYINEAVNEYVDEINSKLDDMKNVKRAEFITEAFETTLRAAAINTAEILNGEVNKDGEKIEDIERRYAKLTEKVIELEKQNSEMLQLGLINELKKDLSLVESEKFDIMAKLIPFEKSSNYVDKLETLKESILNKTNYSQSSFNMNESVGSVRSTKSDNKTADFDSRFGRFI